MGDKLTQLQESMDQLLTQFIAALYYNERHHDLQKFSPSDKIPDLKPDQPPEVETLDPEQFRAGQLELARDLITKEQQIEYLISTLPGLDNSERDQLQMIRELEEELGAAEQQRQEALRERDEVLKRLDGLVRLIRRH
ncbi:putative mediator of RNA polymerase II transcription subunit 21 [Cercophora samala]|uniref:Mediator of RNA polymerase II transcription subunit 21 n=1 Tax=Cercophora samala TaxID=330535 RepID=A0AA39ZHF7_9PEZI|nr:putative mediator of RNA polymerase II transcription subunit 21 [Cercophora samala]